MLTDGLDRMMFSLGGKSLIRGEGRETVQDQTEAARLACDVMAKVFRTGKMALSFGTGPQRGFILDRYAAARRLGVKHPVPLNAVIANTQGSVGSLLQRMMVNALNRDDLPFEKSRKVTSLQTHVIVDEDDESFKDPSTPVGAWMTKEEAERWASESDWTVKEFDSSREDGWRRAVASPRPQSILEENAIRESVFSGRVTICGGGGGIPIVQSKDGSIDPVEAIIRERDFTTVLIAEDMHAQLLVLLTAAPGVIEPEEFKTVGDNGNEIRQLTVAKALAMLPDLDPKMRTKVDAAVHFVKRAESHKRRVLIANLSNVEAAIAGNAGTLISA